MPELKKLSYRKKLLYTVAVTVGVVVLAYSVAEIYVRCTRPKEDLFVLTGRTSGRNPMRQWADLDAFAAYRGRPGSYNFRGVAKTINSHGFISTPEISFDKAPNEVRIVFLGESSTAGMGKNLPDEQTWPWKVAQLMQQALPDRKVTFINAALGGYTSFESYGRLCARVRYFRPDIAILNHGWNELTYFGRPELLKTWRENADGTWGFDQSEISQVVRPMAIDPVLRYSQLFTHLRLNAAAGEGAEADVPQMVRLARYDPAGPEIWRTNLRLFRQTSAVFNIPLLVCKQPTLVVDGLSSAQQARCRYSQHHFGQREHVRAYRALYRVIDQEIEPSRVIDLTALNGVPELFFDHVHPTARCTTRIAEIVAPRLVDLVKRGQPTITAAPVTMPAFLDAPAVTR